MLLTIKIKNKIVVILFNANEPMKISHSTRNAYELGIRLKRE